MVKVSFWGGIGVIGSSKILIEQEGWRLLLDLGLDFHPGQGLFRLGVDPRPKTALADRLRVGDAPAINHVFRTDALRGTSVVGGSDGKTAICISHGHLDHIGLIGWVDPAIKIYASPQTIRLIDALRQSGEGFEGGLPQILPLLDEQELSFGPFKIRRYPVDHDVIGASGYRIETADGVLAYTGDIRLHGRHPDDSLAFAKAVRGARALVIEGTTLSFGFTERNRTEGEVDQLFGQILKETPGLVLFSVYSRNVERIEAFLARAQDSHRQLLWPAAMARLFRALGLRDIMALDEDVRLDDIKANPRGYGVNLAAEHLPLLLDLPVGPASAYVHANGEPFGVFDPRWNLLQEWLSFCHTPFWSIGSGGHASPDDLNRLVELIHPDILFPLHSQAPDRLIPPPGTVRWLPERGGRQFDLAGRELGT